jgi:cellulose synthase/poly-beta-1,6-N-acetylglucosamine synthase-like glycosyltransferase
MRTSILFTFWLFFGIVTFIYFIYPLVIWLLAKLRGKQLIKKKIVPFISFIIPAHNESAVIKEKVDNTLSLDYPREKLEIIFALDGCTDKTRDILLPYRDKGIMILDYKIREGKVKILNKVISKAKGDIIVFSDANSIYENDALRKIAICFSDKNIGCVSGRLKYIDANSTAVGRGENLYWRHENFIKKYESKLGKLLVTNGSIHAVRKSIYPYPNPEIADDFSIPILIQSKGYKVIYEPEAIAYEVVTKNFQEEIFQKTRIILQGFKGTIRLRREILRLGPIGLFEFLFHKFLRWLVPFLLIIIFISNIFLIENMLYFYIFAFQGLFYLFAFIGFISGNKKIAKVFYIPFYFCLVNFTSLLAVYRLCRGTQSRIWDKALTTRINKTRDSGIVEAAHTVANKKSIKGVF